jgi:hypothetical protein
MRRCSTALVILAAASTALGYIHAPPTTLKGICTDSNSNWIRVLTVKDRNEEKGAVTLEVTETLREHTKWESGVASFRLLVRDDAPGGRAVLQELKPGLTVVLFSSEGDGEKPWAFGYACYGEGWYSMQYSPQGKCWVLLRSEADLSTCYHGDAKELPGYVRSVLDGKEVKPPTMAPKEKVDPRERARQIDEAIKEARGEK